MNTFPGLPTTRASGATTYQIQVAGHLEDHWRAWLGSEQLVRNHDGTTTLTLEVADQAQLHGVLARIRDLGVDLWSLLPVEAGSDSTSPTAGDR